MPALPPVPNVLRADLLWSTSGDFNISTVQYFRYSGGPPNSSDAVAFAADFYGAMAAESILWGSDVDLAGVRVTDLSSVSGGQGEHAQNTAGGRTAGALPASTAVLVNYIIARRYRGGKPRSYFPFLVETDLSSRRAWNGSALTLVDSSLSTYFGAVIGTVQGSTTITQHVNVSYYNGFTVVTNPVTGRAKNVSKLRSSPIVDAILSYSANGAPSSQRRRNRGG